MFDIFIESVPSFNAAKKYISLIPRNLTDKQLINTYAKVQTVLNAQLKSKYQMII